MKKRDSIEMDIAELTLGSYESDEVLTKGKNVIHPLVSKTDEHIQGVIKIYEQGTRSDANQEQIALEKVDGITLKAYIQKNPRNLHEALEITLELLSIVKQIHNRNDIHGNITPENIIIRNRCNTPYKDRLILIGFSSTIINYPDGKQNEKVFHEDYVNYADDPNTLFYRVPQIKTQGKDTNATDENERQESIRSPKIDSSHICAILYWLITKKPPRESKNINNIAPHELKESITTIRTEIEKITGK